MCCEDRTRGVVKRQAMLLTPLFFTDPEDLFLLNAIVSSY